MPCATGLQVYNIIADPKHEKHTKENTLNATVLKIQAIYSTVITSK